MTQGCPWCHGDESTRFYSKALGPQLFQDDSGVLLDHFVFAPITSSQTAGSPFSITITALDAHGNTVVSYAGSNSLGDSTGTIAPTSTGAFTSGSWTGSVTINKPQTGVTISTIGNSRTGTSNSFDVNSAGGNRLVITVNPSSVTAGSWTTIYSVQRQDQYGNPVTSGSTTVNLASTSTGSAKKFAETAGGPTVTSITISDGKSAAEFYYYDEKAGSWTISVSATDFTGDSEPLTVNPAALDRFTFDSISSPQTDRSAFSITITARDQYGNTVTTYTGTNILGDSTGTVTPTSTGPFTSGVWTGSVTIPQAQAGVVITTTGSGRTGASNSFDVDDPPGPSKPVSGELVPVSELRVLAPHVILAVLIVLVSAFFTAKKRAQNSQPGSLSTNRRTVRCVRCSAS